MKKVLLFLVCLGFVAGIFAVSYDDNEFARKSRAYSDLAEKAFDTGEYDLSVEYSKLSQEFAEKSTAYIKKMLIKNEAEDSMNKARTRYTWAKNEGAEQNYPTEYLIAGEAIKAGGVAFDNENYDVAIVCAKKALDALKGVQPKEKVSQKTPSQTQPAQVTPPEEVIIVEDTPNPPKKNTNKSVVETPKKEEPPVVTKEEKKEDSLVNEKGEHVLPAQYKVLTWKLDKACLWNIAKNPAVYNNPYLWKKLYDANKDKLPEANNPNWVEPETILVIPSLRGEKREGLYNPDYKYQPLPKR